MRKFQTASGVYSEDELVVAIWVNPKSASSKKVRPLETLTNPSSPLPMAFPKDSVPWPAALHARTKEEVFTLLPKSGRLAPLVVPLPIASAALGWEDFYIATEYAG